MIVLDDDEIAASNETALPDLTGPLRRWRGLTWVGWANLLVLRWFFVRLAYRVNSDNTLGGYFLHRWVWPFPCWRRIGSGRRRS